MGKEKERIEIRKVDRKRNTIVQQKTSWQKRAKEAVAMNCHVKR